VRGGENGRRKAEQGRRRRPTEIDMRDQVVGICEGERELGKEKKRAIISCCCLLFSGALLARVMKANWKKAFTACLTRNQSVKIKDE
jgi:hypothetical protein